MNKPPFFYETEIEWEEGFGAKLQASNLPTLEVTSPPEFGGEEERWTPEHLYVASISSCFMMTFLAIARRSRLEFSEFNVGARGKLDKIEGSGFQITSVVLRPNLSVHDERDLERAGRIVEKAKQSCLIANSMKTKVRIEPIVKSVHREAMAV